MDILIQHLNKSYGPQKAVDDISFEVKTGEILGFLGPNGAGKTTTMKMITGYLPMDLGDVLIGGQSVKTGALKKQIGYLPENNPLYLDMPVMDYLAFCAAIQGVPQSAIANRVLDMVQVCGLGAEKHKRIRELSKGYRQRVGLAQAMIHDPAVLILDEPTTGLDPNQIVEIRELIRKLGQEKTVILSTHILPEVEATCDRILIINKGKIVADGAPATLRKQAQGRQVLQIRLEDAGVEDARQALANLPGVSAVEISNPDELRFDVQSHPEHLSNREIFELCVQRHWILAEMIPLETKLEDVFRDLTVN
ncbi:MAG: ATP-binding cassette domain-containing protein [Saprospiraceae bacterium]|nr:ATP-binding cassette domain-containing protein [Saprospiraceae bacterium]